MYLPIHTPSLASAPPPKPAIATNATNTAGCHTRTNFVLVGGRRNLRQIIFTQNRQTNLDLNMRYLVELDTIAGQITLGPFDTLEAARKYLAGTRGRICPIWPPVAAAANLIESHNQNDLLKKLEKISKGS